MIVIYSAINDKSTSQKSKIKMAQADVEKLERLTASHKAYKGHLTRNINTAMRALDMAANTGANVVMRDALLEAEAKVKDAYSKLEESMLKIQELAVDEYDDLDEKMQEDTTNYEKIMDKLRSMRIQFEPRLTAPPAPAAAGGARAGPKSKPMDSLKPKTLTRDSTPVELKEWVIKFTEFFVSSAFKDVSLVEQQAHFKASLDTHLTNRVVRLISPTTPVFPDALAVEKSAMEHLDDIFMEYNPLFSRRLDWFRYDQGANQPFTDWWEKSEKKGDEADLASLTVDDLKTMRCFTGIRDEVLKAEFLKTPTKTSKELVDVAKNYEMGKKYVKSMGGAVKAMNTGQQRKKSQGNVQGSKAKAKSIFNEGKCFRCGKKVDNRQEHKQECKAVTAVCRKCGKTGHFQSTCLSSSSTQGAPTKAANTSDGQPAASGGATKDGSAA